MKTICYIDASNLIKNGYKVDHQKLLNYLKKRFNADTFYFGAVFVGDYFYKHNFIKSDYLDLDCFEIFDVKIGREKVRKQIDFVKKLKSFGYQTNIKPLKIMLNGKRKADCDVNITVDGMGNLDEYDKFVLFSGDGDFLPFLRFLKNKEKLIEVFSFGEDKKGNSTAREIREFLGGNWYDLNLSDYRNKLEYRK